MAPSKWDDEEDSTPPSSPPLVPVIPRRKFDDEEDEEVLDSWDAAEDSEVEREKAAAAAAAKAKAEAEAAANKKSKIQRIEEHRSQRKLLAEEDTDSSEDEDEAERRARLRKTEKDSDLKHAEDLFGDIDLNRNRGTAKAVVVGDSSDPTKAVDFSAMPLFKPTTKEQFAALTNTLIPLLTPNSKKAQYALWAPEFAKQLVKDLPSDQVKKVASALTALSNEKMREERAADKGAKKSKAAKTKASLNTQRDFAKVDTNAYEHEDFGDDDFM